MRRFKGESSSSWEERPHEKTEVKVNWRCKHEPYRLAVL
jgi:hypothetical protein